MNYVPKGLTRLGHRQLLKLQKNSPTIMVVTGVVGLGATAVMAARATRKIDTILDKHAKQRVDISVDAISSKDEQRQVVRLYSQTAVELGKLYAPTVAVGVLSTMSVLYGHNILKGRHVATMAAYTGLAEQYKLYRSRVAETLGEELELEIYNGATGRYEEDKDHPGEYKLKSKYENDNFDPDYYLRPFFDESNPNWTRDASKNYMFLKGTQNHMNNKLQANGHVLLADVYDALGIPRVKESIVTGWIWNGDGDGDNFIDFGFMADPSPEAVMFRNGAERSVRLNFNIDGIIWNLI